MVKVREFFKEGKLSEVRRFPVEFPVHHCFVALTETFLIPLKGDIMKYLRILYGDGLLLYKLIKDM